MNKKIITFEANEQSLIKTGGISNYSSNKVSYIEAEFELGENWQGFDAVRAIWYNKSEIIATVLSDGHCTVPYEVLTDKGQVKVNLVGSISENDVLTDRLTSYPVVAFIVDAEAKVDGSNTYPITPSQFEQFVEAVKDDAESASASAESASASAKSAHDDKIEIEQAIAEVIQQIEDFEQVQVVVNTLPPTSPATSDFTDGVLTLGIPQGAKGDTGNGIQSIEKISTSGLVDTYRITYTDGNSTTFTVTNGAKGDTGNGIQSIEKTSTQGLVDTYTITYTDGNTSTFTVTNGEKGEQGEVSLDELLDNTIVQTNTDTEPYSFRPTPSCGSLEYDEIVGASVGWNQQANISSSSKSTTKNGITATDNRDGSYTLSGTASAFTPIGLVNEKSWSPNHKYIFWGCPPNGSASTYQLRMRGAGGDTADDGKGALWNPGTTTWKGISAVIQEGTTLNNLVFRPNIVDLTLMLGSTIADYVYTLEQGTAGAGVAWLKSHFDCFNSYQPYDSGSIESVNGLQSHEMVGKNLFDKSTATLNKFIGSDGVLNNDSICFVSDYIKVVPNATYYCNHISGTAYHTNAYCLYDASKNLVGYGSSGVGYENAIPITMGNNVHYIRFNGLMTQISATCINISDASINGTYYPYVKHTYPLDSTLTLRGIYKMDANHNLYADGDVYEPDGTVTRRYGVVDLGTLGYTPLGIGTADARFLCNSINSTLKPAPSNSTLANVICAKYPTASVSARPDKSICVYADSGFIIRDSAFSDVETLKNALSGTYLVYEMKTPTTETATPYTNPQLSYDGGTEEYVSDCIIPIGHSTDYPMTLGDTMPKANGTYTMSVTIANGKRTINWT